MEIQTLEYNEKPAHQHLPLSRAEGPLMTGELGGRRGPWGTPAQVHKTVAMLEALGAPPSPGLHLLSAA